jgi:hypothetical protein
MDAASCLVICAMLISIEDAISSVDIRIPCDFSRGIIHDCERVIPLWEYDSDVNTAEIVKRF